MEVQLAICFLSILFSSSLSSPPVEIAGDALNYLVIGDWGGTEIPPYYTPAEHTLARVMGQKAQEISSDFTVAMGDNFYSQGVKNVDDPRFKETFEVREHCNRATPYMSINTHANHCHYAYFMVLQNVFSADSLQKRWYVFCGNHDHYGNATAQVAYTKKSTRWYMPDLYYTEVSDIDNIIIN